MQHAVQNMECTRIKMLETQEKMQRPLKFQSRAMFWATSASIAQADCHFCTHRGQQTPFSLGKIGIS